MILVTSQEKHVSLHKGLWVRRFCWTLSLLLPIHIVPTERGRFCGRTSIFKPNNNRISIVGINIIIFPHRAGKKKKKKKTEKWDNHVDISNFTVSFWQFCIETLLYLEESHQTQDYFGWIITFCGRNKEERSLQENIFLPEEACLWK